MINDRYKIKKKLGSDKYNIYLCTDIFNPAKDIVIKVLTTDTNEKDLETFRNEFFLLKKLNHPNIVRAYEYGTVVKIEKEEKEIKRDYLDRHIFIDNVLGPARKNRPARQQAAVTNITWGNTMKTNSVHGEPSPPKEAGTSITSRH